MQKTVGRRAATVLLSLASFAAIPAAKAELMTFTAIYGPTVESTVKSESAIATFTIDTDLIGDTSNPAYQPAITSDQIVNLSLTIQGAPVGNGTYGAADFVAITFAYYGPLDYTKQLVGQRNDAPINDELAAFGQTNSGKGGFFGLIGATSSTPTEWRPFELQAAGSQNITNYDSLMRLTSLTAVPYASTVPEPSRIAMMLVGLGFAGLMARSKRA